MVSVDIIYKRHFLNHSGVDIDYKREFLELLQTEPVFKKLRFLALWSKLVELSIVSNGEGLSPDEEGVGLIWNEGSEVIFEGLPQYNTLFLRLYIREPRP
jgi:hypothetical protein